MSDAGRVVARVGGAGFRYWERGFRGRWTRDDAAIASDWPPSGSFGLEHGLRRWSGAPAGVIVYFNREDLASTSLLVEFTSDDGSRIHLPLRFNVAAKGRAAISTLPSPKHIPLHRMAFGRLVVDRGGQLAWWFDQLGPTRRALVHETLVAALRESGNDAVLRWSSKLVVEFLRGSWVGCASRLLRARAAPERVLWSEAPGVGMEAFIRHLASCGAIKEDSVCPECLKLATAVRSAGDFWRDTLALLSAATARVEVAMRAPPSAADLLLIIEDTTALMKQSGASPPRRRAALDRLARTDPEWLLGLIPEIFARVRVERGTVANAPWTLLYCLRSSLLDANAITAICDSGWGGQLGIREFQRIAHSLNALATPTADRALAAMAYWEVSARHGQQMSAPLVARVLKLCNEVATLEVERTLRTVAHSLVSSAIDALAHLNPRTRDRQHERFVDETEQMLRALPAGTVKSRNAWLDAFRRLPWVRQRLALIAAKADPTSPASGFWAAPEAGPLEEEMTSAVAELESATGDRWQTLLTWCWTSLSLPGTRSCLPPPPRVETDGTVAGSVSYWKAFLWGLPQVRGSRAVELWRWLVPAIAARFRQHPNPEVENNAWMALGDYLERRPSLRDAAWSSVVLARFEEITALPTSLWSKRPITLLRCISLMVEDGEAFRSAWSRVEESYRGVGDEGFRQRCLTMLERRKDISQLFADQRVRRAIAGSLRSSTLYIAVGAVRCVAAAAGILSVVDWLHHPRDHGKFWQWELDTGALARWAVDFEEAVFDGGVWHARYVAWLSDVALGVGAPGFYKDVGKYTMVLRSLERLDGVAAQDVARQLARAGTFEPVLRWLAERGGWTAHMAGVLEELVGAMAAAAESDLEQFAQRLAMFERRGIAEAANRWPVLLAEVHRRLASTQSALSAGFLLAALAAAPPGTPGRWKLAALRKAREVLEREGAQSDASRLVCRLLAAAALETAAPHAPSSGSESRVPLRELLAGAMHWIETAPPSENFGYFANWIEERFEAGIPSGSLYPVLSLAGGTRTAPPETVARWLGDAARAALSAGADLGAIERSERIEELREEVRQLAGMVDERIVDTALAGDISTDVLVGQIEAPDRIPRALVAEVSLWTSCTAARIEQLWRALRLRRLRRTLDSAALLLHDLRSVDNPDEVGRQLTQFESELQLIDDPDVQRYEDVWLLAQEIVEKLYPRFSGAIETDFVATSEAHTKPQARWLSLDDLERLFHNLISNGLRHGIEPLKIELHRAWIEFRSGRRKDGPPPEHWDRVTKYLSGNPKSGLEDSIFPPHTGLQAVRNLRRRNPDLWVQAYAEETPEREEVVFAVHWYRGPPDGDEGEAAAADN